MPFDFALDFRGSLPYATDPAYADAALGENFPHTYTNGNALTINAGWDGSALNYLNLASTNDPRIAGSHFIPNIPSKSPVFTFDLSSGSAPGAGTYTIDFASGVPANPSKAYIRVYDDTAVVIDGGAGTSLAADHYLDASLADVGATTTWTGATANKVFATTTMKFRLNPDAIDNAFADNSGIAHFRLTLATVASGWGPLIAMRNNRLVGT